MKEKQVYLMDSFIFNINNLNTNMNIYAKKDIFPILNKDINELSIDEKKQYIKEAIDTMKTMTSNAIANSKDILKTVTGVDAIKYILTKMKGTALYYYVKNFVLITIKILDVRKPSIAGYNNSILKKIRFIQHTQNILLNRLNNEYKTIGKEKTRMIAKNITDDSIVATGREKLYRDFLITVAKKERELKLVLDKYSNYKILHINKLDLDNLLKIVKEYFIYLLKELSKFIVLTLGGVNIFGNTIYSVLNYLNTITTPGTMLHTFISTIIHAINTIITFLHTNAITSILLSLAPIFALMFTIYVIYRFYHYIDIRIKNRISTEEVQKKIEQLNSDPELKEGNEKIKKMIDKLATIINK